MGSYNFIEQEIKASTLIQGKTNDSFYWPIQNLHSGFAADGNFYSMGSIVPTHPQASWFLEYGTNPFRGNQAAFPTYGLVLLTPAALIIINQSQSVSQASNLPMWMLFLLENNNALTDNFNSSVQGFSPKSVCYADGIVSVTYTPDEGNQQYFNHINPTPPPPIKTLLPPYPSPYPVVAVQSSLVVSIDFSLDQVYLDVAV